MLRTIRKRRAAPIVREVGPSAAMCQMSALEGPCRGQSFRLNAYGMVSGGVCRSTESACSDFPGLHPKGMDVARVADG